MRASDADREQYVSHLQSAYAEGRLSHEEYDERLTKAYEAVTFADLYPLLIDLPVDIADLPVPPMTPSQQLERTGNREVVSRRSVTVDDSPAVAVLSETRRGGRWVVPAKQFSTAVLGNVSLDLQEALLDAGSVEIRAVAVMGEVSIIVPDDIHVDVVGAGVLGEFVEVDERSTPLGSREPPPGAPRLKVSGAAVMGSVKVRIVTASVPVQNADSGVSQVPFSPPPHGPPIAPPPAAQNEVGAAEEAPDSRPPRETPEESVPDSSHEPPPEPPMRGEPGGQG